MARSFLVVPVVSLVLTGCGWGGTEVEPEQADASLPELTMVVPRGDRSADAISRDLELQPQKDWADLVDLGTAYLWQGRWYEAAEAYEVAARSTDHTDELAAALYGKSAALAYAGRVSDALATADTLTDIAPDNADAAWLRYALYARSGDQLGALVARDHVLRVDPEAAGHQVFDPITAATVGTVAIVAIAAATSVSVVYLTPPEDRAEVVVPVFTAFAGIAGVGLDRVWGGETTSGPDLGRKLAAQPQG